MSENRDTQFKGFAEKLYQELQTMACSFRVSPGADVLKQRECEIIAQRAYDLVAYTMSIMPHLIQAKPNIETVEEALHYIPDLTELPNQAE